MRKFLVSLFLVTVVVAANLVSTNAVLAAEKANADEIFQELRSVTCEGERLADCKSEQSKLLREQISGWVNEGKSRSWILNQVSSTYGDYIMLEPPKQGFSLLLWLSPFALLGVGALLVWFKATIWAQNSSESEKIDSKLAPSPYLDQVEKELQELNF